MISYNTLMTEKSISSINLFKDIFTLFQLKTLDETVVHYEKTRVIKKIIHQVVKT